MSSIVISDECLERLRNVLLFKKAFAKVILLDPVKCSSRVPARMLGSLICQTGQNYATHGTIGYPGPRYDTWTIVKPEALSYVVLTI